MSATGLLVMARCFGFVFRAPGFSHPSVPPMLRAMLALALAVVLTPVVRSTVHPDGAALAFAAAAELCVGAAIGAASSVLYDGAYAGGRALDDYVGIRAGVPGPDLGPASGFGRVWSLTFTAAFFVLGGYQYAIVVFARSFETLGPGATLGAQSIWMLGPPLARAVLEAALLVAAPSIALAFTVQLALGAMSRVIPRFASFTLSFPLVFGAVLVATAISAPALFARGGIPWFPLAWLMPGAP